MASRSPTESPTESPTWSQTGFPTRSPTGFPTEAPPSKMDATIPQPSAEVLAEHAVKAEAVAVANDAEKFSFMSIFIPWFVNNIQVIVKAFKSENYALNATDMFNVKKVCLMLLRWNVDTPVSVDCITYSQTSREFLEPFRRWPKKVTLSKMPYYFSVEPQMASDGTFDSNGIQLIAVDKTNIKVVAGRYRLRVPAYARYLNMVDLTNPTQVVLLGIEGFVESKFPEFKMIAENHGNQDDCYKKYDDRISCFEFMSSTEYLYIQLEMYRDHNPFEDRVDVNSRECWFSFVVVPKS